MAHEGSTCPVCFSPAEIERALDSFKVVCPRCGKFKLSGTADRVFRLEAEENETGQARLGPRDSRRRANASAWILENAPASLDSRDCARLALLHGLTVSERLQKLMLRWAKESKHVGHRLDPLDPKVVEEWIARTWSLDVSDLNGLVQLAYQRGFLLGRVDNTNQTIRPPASLTAEGWAFVEHLEEPNADSPQGFVAMWFHPSMDGVYERAIAPAIEAAGYRPHRVDQREFTGRIDDEIVAQIRRSRFVVADLTRGRPSVYYEAGWGHGLGLEVFFTAKRRAKLHFDIRQHNTIFWKPDRLELFRSALQTRIERVLGRGPVQPV